MSPDKVHAVAERVDACLATSVWDLAPARQVAADVSTAAEVAVFALKLSGKRRQARLGGRFSRLVVRFSLAACVALASAATACEQPSSSPEATAQAVSQLPDSASPPTITAQPRASPARFTELVLLDAGSASQAWALMAPKDGDAPVLVDRAGAGLDTVGGMYSLAAQPVTVGTRDGPSQFLDALQAAVSTGNEASAASVARDQLVQRWGQDERYLAATRAIGGQPTVLDAAYNAAAASAAGGTHTYLSGVVLRVEPDNPVLAVIDRALLESKRPTRAEDVVYVAIRPSEVSLYEPGQVVNLRDVVVDKQTTDVNGQPATVYVANAALDGARVEPTEHVDLQALLQPRLQVVNEDLALQDQVASSVGTPAPLSAPQPTAAPGATTPPVQQPIIVQQSNNNGSSYIGDFLIFMWLTNGGFYRGGRGTTIINNYPVYNSGRPGGSVYYSPPPAPGGSSPSTIASSQAASRSTALEAARSSVSGQSSGTGGGVAATNKSAADATSRVSAATSKSAAVAGAVSASSAGKSIASAPSSASSSTASRSAGSVSAGSRGSVGSSSGSSSGSKGIGGSSSSSGSSGGFGGKGIGGGTSSSS
ncbi:MAG: hypothetical protein ACR2IK_07460 [Chloroflexota bacterium]